MNSFLETLNNISSKLLDTIRRFPLALVSAFLFTLIVIVQKSAHRYLEYNSILETISFLCFFGFFLFVGLRLIAKSWLLPTIGLFFVIGFYFYMPVPINEYITHEQGEIIYPMMLIGLFFLIIVAPFVTYSGSNREFFEWLKKFIYTLAMSAIVGIVLFIVLNVAFSIIEKLFDIDSIYQPHKQISLFVFTFIAPFFFLSQIPKEPRGLKQKEYNYIEKIFFKYILSSLFIAYFFIIYIYTAKMIILSEYPKGVLSWNIIAFSALAILTYLFWTPLWNEKNQKYKKLIWISIILQTILLAVAIYLRVEPYGWTLGRVVLSSFGIWLFILSIYFLIVKKHSYRAVFISIPIIIALNLLFGSAIGKSSQQDRLGTLLSHNQHLSDESNISVRYNISSKIDYLYQHYGTDALLPIIPTIVTEYENQKDSTTEDCKVSVIKNFPIYATDQLGFKYINRWKWREHLSANTPSNMQQRKFYNIKTEPFSLGMDIKSYYWMMNFYYKKRDGFRASSICPSNAPLKKGKFTIETEGKNILIKENNTTLAKINLDEFIDKILKKDKNIKLDSFYRNDFTQEEFTYLYKNDKVNIKLLFYSFESLLNNEITGYGGVGFIGLR